MADTKITALTALTGADPANDVIPIVDVSDTTMAASGTTKKISVNNILGASGTATLASATITGDLTVDTNVLKVDSATNNVSIGGLVNKVTGVSVSGTGLTIQAPAVPTLGIWDTTDPSYFTNLAQIDANFYFYNNAAGALVFGVGNNESMRLNSTGLGVGGSPTAKLTIFAGADGDVGFFRGGSTRQLQIGTSATAGYLNSDNGSAGFELRVNGVARAYFDTSGNCGIGVTPSAWDSGFQAIENSGGSLWSGSTGAIRLSQNVYYATSLKYKNALAASQYVQTSGQHQWFTAPSGTAGTAITFTQAMTLESTGSLVLGAAAVATTATDGFLYIPSCAGAPTGIPTAKTGRVPMVVDSTNNRFYVYVSGAWKFAALI